MSEPTPAPLATLAYKLEDASRVTGISLRMLYTHRDAGLVTFTKNGRHNIILADDLQAMLVELRNRSTDAAKAGA